MYMYGLLVLHREMMSDRMSMTQLMITSSFVLYVFTLYFLFLERNLISIHLLSIFVLYCFNYLYTACGFVFYVNGYLSRQSNFNMQL